MTLLLFNPSPDDSAAVSVGSLQMLKIHAVLGPRSTSR